MISGPHDERHCVRGVRTAPRDRAWSPHRPSRTRPRSALSTVTSTFDVEPRSPLLELFGIEELSRRAGSVEDDQLAEPVAVVRAPGRSPDAAGRARCRRPRTTRSRPSAASTGQGVPNGPRTPTVSPGRTSRSARVTAPTPRMVWTSRRGRAGSPLIEIGDLPDPERVQHGELAGQELERPRSRPARA